jgi:hypothetical protein
MANLAGNVKKKLKNDVEEEDQVDDFDGEEAIAGEQDGMEDQFEAALSSQGLRNTWMEGGVKKDIVIRVLIQCFASMVESEVKQDAVPDHKGRYRQEDMIYHKLLDASKQVVKAKK